MRSIQRILSIYQTDKHNSKEHSYGDFYAELFNKYDREGRLNILELGVQRGGSLYAWKEYFPFADVTGVDIKDTRLDIYNKCPVIKFILGDLRQVISQFKGKKFDIIIDDSDHSEETMAWIAKHYFPLLKPKGTLVFEDIQIPDRYLAKIELVAPSEAVIDIFDLRHIKGRPDDYIITLTKP